MFQRALTSLTDALRASSWLSYAVGVLLMASIATNGLEHGHIYSRQVTGDRHALFEEVGLHGVDMAQEGAYYALAFIAAPNPLAVVGASMLARPLFQIPINLAAGRHILWAPRHFTVRIGGEVVFSRPVPLRGVWQLVWAALGLALLALHVRIGRAAASLLGRFIIKEES